MRALSLPTLLLALLSAFAASAQTTAPATAAAEQAAPAASGPPEQRIERIHIEDAGSRVDEVRYGGTTQSIVVSPKSANTPAYEIVPTDGARTRPTQRDGAESTTGSRVWTLRKF
ncbi:hypothetical protein [Xylophilus sp.]|uniref:hypothetical protein n=1 Tax=Xylophilus sp. TaxID=2653893 RepID=UPI0013B78B7D|nr:hypothetical protein [Xylophilus sp.]KAF1043783.1 MAG: hypothetical protein GAK38_03828 [Xylophilus sp.]